MTPANTSKRGRPAIFVLGPDGIPITGLSYDKATKMYYATYSKPKKYFGSNYDKALFRFHKWLKEQEGEEPSKMKHHIQLTHFSNNLKKYLPKGETKLIINEDGKLHKENPIEDEDLILKESYKWKIVREMLLTNRPEVSAQKTGLKGLVNLDIEPDLKPSISITDLLEFYFSKKTITKLEQSKVKNHWHYFCDIIKKEKLNEIFEMDIHKYNDTVVARYKKEKLSSTWLKGRFEKIIRIFLYNLKNPKMDKTTIRRILDYCKIFDSPQKEMPDPKPISRENFHKLLDVANEKYKVIMMLAANCGYYAKDLQDLKKEYIIHSKDYSYIKFPREKRMHGKRQHLRINILWKETDELLKKYLQYNKGNHSEYVFVNRFGNSLNTANIDEHFNSLKEKAKISKDVMFSHFRDAVASTLFGSVEDDLIRVMLGHAIKGEKEMYILVNPHVLLPCSQILHKEYME